MMQHQLYRRCKKLFRQLEKAGQVRQEGNVSYGDGGIAHCYNAKLPDNCLIERQTGRVLELSRYMISSPLHKGRFLVEPNGLDSMTMAANGFSRVQAERALDKILKANGV